MTAATCIPDLVDQGKLTGKRAEEAMRLYRRHEARFLGEMSPEAAAIEASKAVVDEMERTAAMKDRRAKLQIQAQKRVAVDMASYKGPRHKAAAAILATDEHAPFMSVDRQADAILGRAHAMMDEVLQKHRRNLLGDTRNKADLDDLVRERFGEDSGNAAAKELSEAFGNAAEYMRNRHNRAGGDIGTRADWGLPQSHDGMRIRSAGYEAWKADIVQGLDLGRMVDSDTGRAFTPDALEDALRDAYDAIASDGWSRIEPGKQSGRGTLATQRSKHRFFVFKSADHWLAYQDKYGTADAFGAMMGHLEGMSRDIALMERMGPNPEATLQYLKDVSQKDAGDQLRAGNDMLDQARGAVLNLDHLWGAVAGGLNTPVNERWARRMGGVRSFLTSTMLGSAALSAVTDVGFQATTRAFNGLPITGALTGYLKHLDPRSAADRRLAVRLGLQAEDAARSMAALGRFIDQGNTPEIAGRMADFVLRVSGLNAWTQVGRWDFGLTVLGHIADERGKGWTELDPAFRNMMDRHGIDVADWDAMRSADVRAERGGEWADPMAMDEAVGDKVLRMVAHETDFAVPTASAQARAALSFGQRPGTAGGELLRNMFLFKSFGVSMLMTHGARMMAQKGWNRAAYFAGLTITTTLLGALSLQLREIAKGRDVQDMASPDFWGKAILQGGGYGIFGDFLTAAERSDQFGGGPIEMLAGPVASAGVDVLKTGKHLLGEGAEAIGLVDSDGKNKLGKDAIRMLKRYMPGGSLWYARLAFERTMLDQLQEQIDPDYSKSWARMEKRAQQETGQDFYWRAGEALPDRLPGMAEAPE